MTERGAPQYETAVERVFRKALPEPNSGCWLWDGVLSDGYGATEVRGRQVKAHRFAYEALVGPVPQGLVLDHKCRTRCCVNPEHLDPVAQGENARRGETGQHLAKRTHCPRGHEYSEDNTGRGSLLQKNHRRCLTCHRESERKRRLSSH